MMKHNISLQSMALTALMIVCVQANAITINLCTGITTKTMADGEIITLWGYGLDTGGACSATVPGPQLDVPAGDNALTLNLRNTLSVPISVVINGQQASMTPVFFNDAQGRQRVRSFTHETPAGMTGIYSWSNVKPGTFLYNSGTHPSVQVQMGLYGVVIHDHSLTEAYPGVSSVHSQVVVFSEIDPVAHEAAADNPATVTSTVNYTPRYFLMNGEEVPLAASITRGTQEPVLLRLVNAGLQSRVAMMQGQYPYMTLVAEDGNVYPYAKQQYAALMAAGKTRDALFNPAEDGNYALYDRRLQTVDASGNPNNVFNMSVATVSNGAAPVAVNDSDITAEDTPVIMNVTTNDTDADGNIDISTVSIVSQAPNGAAVSHLDGTVTYTPKADFYGSDSFTYSIGDLLGNTSNAATVSITVTPVNDAAPVAMNDGHTMIQDTVLNVAEPGVLTNDTDVDGDALTAVFDTGTTNGIVSLNPNGSFSYTPNPGITGTDSFTYHAHDGTADSLVVTVTITIDPPVNQVPVANDDYVTVTRNRGSSNNAVTLDVTANDTDAEGFVVPASVIIVSDPNKGSVINHGDGSVTYTPRAGFRGSDAFGYTVSDGVATSNLATVRVDVVK